MPKRWACLALLLFFLPPAPFFAASITKVSAPTSNGLLTAGVVEAGPPKYPDGGMKRIGEVRLPFDSTRHLTCAVLDGPSKYAYFGTDGYPAQVIKVAFEGDGPPTIVGTITLNAGEDNLRCVTQLSYNELAFGAMTIPGRIIRIATNGDGPPLRTGSLKLNFGEDFLSSATTGPFNSNVYFGTNTVPGRIVTISNSLGGDMRRLGALLLAPGQDYLTSAGYDFHARVAYFGTNTTPGRIVTAAIPSIDALPTTARALTLDEDEGKILTGDLEPYGGAAAFVSTSGTSKIIRLFTNHETSSPVRTSELTLEPQDGKVLSSWNFGFNGKAFYGTQGSPARIVKVLTDQTFPSVRVGALNLNEGESAVRSLVHLWREGFALLGVDAQPSRIVKVKTSRIGVLQGMKIEVPHFADVERFQYYLNDVGTVSYAIYDGDSAPRRLLWSNTYSDGGGNWTSRTIASGTPQKLILAPGTYWLASVPRDESDSIAYVQGSPGTGFTYAHPTGDPPEELDPSGVELTDENWTMNISYDPIDAQQVADALLESASDPLDLNTDDHFDAADITTVAVVDFLAPTPTPNPVPAPSFQVLADSLAQVGSSATATIRVNSATESVRGGVAEIRFDPKIFEFSSFDARFNNSASIVGHESDSGHLTIIFAAPGALSGRVQEDIAIIWFNVLKRTESTTISCDESRFFPEIQGTEKTSASIQTFAPTYATPTPHPTPIVNPSIRLLPSTGTMKEGQITELQLYVDTAEESARGGAARLIFDPQLFRVISVVNPDSSPFNLSPPPAITSGKADIMFLERNFALIEYTGPIAIIRVMPLATSPWALIYLDSSSSRFAPPLDGTSLNGGFYEIAPGDSAPTPTVTPTPVATATPGPYPAPNIQLVPASGTLRTGEITELQLYVDTGLGLARGGAVILEFDPDLIEIVSIEKTGFPPFDLLPPPSIESDSVLMSFVESGFRIVQYSGPLAVIRVRALDTSSRASISFDSDVSRFAPALEDTSLIGGEYQIVQP